MPEDYEEFISLILRTRNPKKPLRMLARNWKHRWLPLCLARQARRVSMGRSVAKPMSSNQNLRVSWKLVNPQDCVWKNLYRIIMRNLLQERGTIHCNIIIRYTNLFQNLKLWKFLQQKQRWIKNGKNWRKFRRGTWRKSEVKKRWSMKQGPRANVHFASLMDICHLRNAELEPKHQKYKGRVVLRGDIVREDSGSYAVVTEQGSSASQMTAARVMDITSRLLGCAGQAADAVSASTQVKMEDAPKLLKIPKSECPDIWIRLPRHKWPKLCSSMGDPVVPPERNLYGHLFGGLLRERQFEKILLKYG